MRFRMLGPLEVTDGDDRLPLGGPKQRLVLAHLLIKANQVAPSDLLIDEIWGEEPPDAARTSLQSYVSNLRKVLGGDRVVGRAPGYLLRASAEEIDASCFETLVVRARRTLTVDPPATARLLREAMSLWQGEALADLSGEPSLQPEIERLSEMRLEAFEQRVEADLALGRHGEVVAELERVQAANTTRERLCAHLMLALYRAGRQADALAAYHRLRRSLDEELGVDPSPAIERLHRQILNHDPTLELRGEPLRGYRLIEQIAATRRGRVHRALDPQAEREVAIKVLGARLANEPSFIRRFDAEARRVARLEHPHVVPLYDWWREPDAAYLVMRLMRGGSLAGRLDAGQVTPHEALLWTEQIGSALSTAHRHGVIHDDLSSTSVLLDGDGNAYLSDFATGYDAASGHSPAALSRLAPERRTGGPPSIPADVYAFGQLLSELFERAIPEDDGSSLRAVLGRAASSTAADRPQSPSDLADAVRRALLTSTDVSPALDENPDRERNPYKGLRAFEEADAADFFGREALVSQLVARMNEPTATSRLLAVVGPSGSGKSSVVSAGLVPALRNGGVPGADRWLMAAMTPGERPFERLERALLGVAVDASAPLAELTEADDGLHDAIGRVLPPDTELLLVIDQFEELFTLVADESVRQRFLNLMAGSIEDRTSRVRVVITLRADFYDRPLRHERFGHLLAARTHAVAPLTIEELQRAVKSPAERAGLRLESGLVVRIVADMREQSGALPLLQYALAELWERRDGSRLSVSAYDASGGIAAAVGRRAEELVVQLDEDGRELARQLFLRLIELGEGTSDTARRVLRSQLQALGADRDRVDTLIERFARFRLLLIDRDPATRGATVEMAHEALLRAWPRLQRWVDEARGDLRSQRALASAASLWAEEGREPSFLLTGSRLTQTDQWAASTRILLTDDEREYLSASTAERKRIDDEEEQRRAHEMALERRSVTRLRGLVVALGIGALVAGGLSLFALSESERAGQEARVASAQALAAAALVNLPIDPERSILLALEAVAATRSVDGSVLPEAEDALHRAVAASRLVLRVPDVGGHLSWSPDGSAFVTEGPEDSGMLDVRNAASGESLLSWHGHEVDVNAVAYSHDGSMLVSTGDDGAAVVWDPATGEALSRIGGRGEVWGPTFDPDGTLVAAVWVDEDLVRAWDPATGRVVHSIPVVGPSGASFSPDGSSLAIVAHYGEEVVVLDLDSKEQRFTLYHDINVFDVAWSPDGRWIATAGRLPAARIWDASTGNLRFTVGGPLAHNGDASVVRWSPDSSRLATGGSDGSAKVWEVGDQGPYEALSVSAQDTALGSYGLAFSPDGNLLMTGAWSTMGVQIWDVRPGGEIEWATLANRPGDWGAVAFSPGGHLLASRTDGSVSVLDLRAAEDGRTLSEHEDVVTGIDVSPDGQLLATAGGGDKTARVWDLSDGDLKFEVAHPGVVYAVAWSSDGSVLATAGAGGRIIILDRSGHELATLADDPASDILALDFSRDGRRLAAAREGFDSAVVIWDWEDASVLMTLPVWARDIAFDSTGDQLVTAGQALGVTIWNLETGEPAQTLYGQVSPMWGVAFSPDNATVAAGSFEGPVRLWDVESGSQTLVLRGHTAPVNGIAFSPDGSQLASTSVDGTVRVWALDLDDLIYIAGRKLHRTLSDDECRQYLQLEACPTGH